MPRFRVTIPILFLISIQFSGCFGGHIAQKGSVLGYKNGVVRTEGGKFRVGILSEAWVPKNIAPRAVLFQHKQDFSTITTESWCGTAANDTSLETLSRELWLGLNDFKLSEKKIVQLAGRDALQTAGQGKMDGQEVFFGAYVLKMNACVFDFVYIGFPPQTASYDDFKAMVEGFEFIKGPKIL